MTQGSSFIGDYRRPGECVDGILKRIRERNFQGAETPPPLVVEQMVDAAFFASLLNEEGVSIRSSLSLWTNIGQPNPPGDCRELTTPVELTANLLRKLSVGLDPNFTSLAVRPRDEKLEVWAFFNNWRRECVVPPFMKMGGHSGTLLKVSSSGRGDVDVFSSRTSVISSIDAWI